MENLIPLTSIELGKITNHRSGEIKFGEKMLTIPKGVIVSEFLRDCKARFVLFGIPEDIGVRANFGRPGTHSAWESALKSIANIQHNRFCKGSQILVLGKLDIQNDMEVARDLDFHNTDDRKKLTELVEKIDKEVSHIVFTILKSGKIPIIIGGGHNNAYGNIKGLALAKGKPVNVVNFDAHSDFRILEGRHSGNGFSYAFDEGFLKKYFIYGLHESYTSKNVLLKLKDLEDRVRFNTYDEIAIRKEKNFEQELTQALQFIKNEPFGIELDLDALPGVASSAMTLSGFSIEQARQYIHHFGASPNACYLHICEGAPDLDHPANSHLIGKLIGYIVTDFIKSKSLLEV
ncbi:MAG: formimidoylglutamase [Flavobacterium sp.]